MMKINNLTAEAVTLLNKVYKHFPDDLPIEEWLKKCDKGDTILTTQEKSRAHDTGNDNGIDEVVYAGFIEIFEKGLVLKFAGAKDNEWDISEVINQLKTICKFLGKDTVWIAGRKGWLKKLKPYGFEIDTLITDEFLNTTSKHNGNPTSLYVCKVD